MMRRLVLGFCLLAGCGGPAFESEAVELEYLDSLSNPTPEQFLRRKQLHAAAERAAEEERIRLAEEERRRNTPEAKAKAKAESEAIDAEQVRIAKRTAEREEAARRREDEAGDALDTAYRAAVAQGNTPEALRAAYQSIVDRYPGTDPATISQQRLDELGPP